jgi:predicted O-methyltransferase YrrM
VAELQLRVADLESAGQRFQAFPPGHYYSPVPDLDALAKRPELFAFDPTNIPGIDLRIPRQWDLLEELRPLAADVPFPDERGEDYRFWFDNDSYANGDATTLHSVLRHFRPARMIEIGAGYSTLCTLDTIEHYDLGTHLTVVEPYPDRLLSLLRPGDMQGITLLTTPIEQVDLSVFDQLESGDVVFIDSTHVAKTGSDVVFELHRVLPRLAKGVVIHFHDIFPGFEYPQPWVFEGRGWNEAYVLRAFLELNSSFQIKLWPSLLHWLDPARAETLVPELARNVGGCLWLMRVA